MPQQSKVERTILGEIEESQEEKRKRREFRQKQQARAERKRLRQEEKLRIQKETKAKREARKRQREAQRILGHEATLPGRPHSASRTQTDEGSDLGDTAITVRSEDDTQPRLQRSGTTVSGMSYGTGTSDASDNLADSDDEASGRHGSRRMTPQLSRQASRNSLRGQQRATTGSMFDDAPKKLKSSITGAISGGLQKTGAKVIRTGTTVGLLLGVVPSKSSRDFLRRKVAKLLPKRIQVGRLRNSGSKETADDDDAASEDSETEQIKEVRRKFREKQLRSSASLDGANDNVLARAREAVGIPESEEEYSCWLRMQSRTGILWCRMQIAVRKLHVQDHPPHPSLKKFVESLRFEAAIGVLIVLNGIISGMDAMYKADEERAPFITWAENFFVVVFVLEYFLRLRANTWVFMFEPMNIFDTFVVWVTGVLVVWILEPSGITFDPLRRLAALRVLRLGRLARAVRTKPMFHELWMLVSGVLECLPLLFWSMVIIAIVHFMFAVAVMEIITKAEVFKGNETVWFYFPTLAYSMFTLFQFMTFDSWAGPAREIIAVMPEAAALILFFLGVAGIVLFNLMTAIVVKNAFDAAEADEEAKAQQQVQNQATMAADLREMFQALDEDGSGTLSREEFTDVLDDVMFIRHMKKLDIDLEELPDIFDILDDGDGNITTEEFCMGLTRLQGVAMSRDMLRCTSRNMQLNALFAQVSECMGVKVDNTLGKMEMSMEATHENLVELQQMTAEVLRKLEEAGLHRAVRSTTEGLDELAPPTLEEIAKQEEEAARQADLAKFGRVTKVVKPSSQPRATESFPRIPATWVLTRKKDLEQRKQAMRAQQWEDVAAETVKEVQELPGVLQEFQETWSGLDVQVPQQTREDRIAQTIKTQTASNKSSESKGTGSGAGDEMKLPAKLPSALAPRSIFPQQEEADGQEAAEEADAEKVTKDVNKMNIKELKEVADSLGLEHEGLRKVQLLPLVIAKQEEVANLGKAPLSMM
ncbi:para [Symbiodinium sp. CCMP2592]|nr:para [Symbiodinium sp. CCMP2592]